MKGQNLESMVQEDKNKKTQSYINHAKELFQLTNEFESRDTKTEANRKKLEEQVKKSLKNRGFFSLDENNLDSAFKKFVDHKYGNEVGLVENLEDYLENEIEKTTPEQLLTTYKIMGDEFSDYVPTKMYCDECDGNHLTSNSEIGKEHLMGGINHLLEKLEKAEKGELDEENIKEELASYYSEDYEAEDKLKSYLIDHYDRLGSTSEIEGEWRKVMNNKLIKTVDENEEDIKAYCNETAENVSEGYKDLSTDQYEEAYNITKSVAKLPLIMEQQKNQMEERERRKQQLMQQRGQV